MDEAGRGSLAGPLLAAGVLIDLERIGRSERLALARLDRTDIGATRTFAAVVSRAAWSTCFVPGDNGKAIHRKRPSLRG